jgi:hypothetical protein
MRSLGSIFLRTGRLRSCAVIVMIHQGLSISCRNSRRGRLLPRERCEGHRLQAASFTHRNFERSDRPPQASQFRQVRVRQGGIVPMVLIARANYFRSRHEAESLHGGESPIGHLPDPHHGVDRLQRDGPKLRRPLLSGMSRLQSAASAADFSLDATTQANRAEPSTDHAGTIGPPRSDGAVFRPRSKNRLYGPLCPD